MADDERRAEIEAVWAEMRHALADARTRATPQNPKVKAYWCDRIGLVLDRVRDARGDDEARACCGGDPSLPHIAGCPEIARERIAQSPQGDGEAHTKGCIQGEIDSECPCEARSPQGEDHEAGIEAARLKLPSAWRHDGTVDEGEALTRVMVAAYLSRVSPSRDGTVAVEDVARLTEALRLIGEHARLDESERGIAEASRYYGIAEHALTEFARPVTGEQTEHGGQDDERRR